MHKSFWLKKKPEWKFKTNVARNATLGHQGQKTGYFQEFHFSQSALKSQN